MAAEMFFMPEAVALHHCSQHVSLCSRPYTKSLISHTGRQACVFLPSTYTGSYIHPLLLRYRFSMAPSSRYSSRFCMGVVLFSMYRKRSAQLPSRVSRSAARSSVPSPRCSWCTASLAWKALSTTFLA